jgi:hypothetical protein
MSIRTSAKTVIFSRPFSLKKGVDRVLPAGDYRVLTDEELIEGLSFPVYRRVSTMIFLPAEFHRPGSVELVTIDPLDLLAAEDRDAETHQVSETDAAAPRINQPAGLALAFDHTAAVDACRPLHAKNA